MGIEDTIIIGAGISGLACARTLFDNGKKFKIISEDVGGRIVMSKKGNVPYGAYFVGSDYDHVLNFVKKMRKIDFFSIKFHKGKLSYLTKSSIKYPLQLMKIIFILLKFRVHYSKLKKRCVNVSQKEAIMNDKYLFKLYKQKAADFVKQNKISEIVDMYLGEASHGLLFCNLNGLYAFEFLRWIQYLILPVWEFKFLKNKITKGFKNRIIIDSVKSVRKCKGYYKVKTVKKSYNAKNVVVATPVDVSKKLLRIKRIKKPCNAYMFHISGKPILRIGAEFEFFHESSDLFDLAHQADGTYLFYCDNPRPKLNKYFNRYKVIAKKHWNPAFNLNGNILLECELDERLYLIGDHNICGLDDSFITGVYAANRIID